MKQREIKFRYYDKTLKKYVPQKYLIDDIFSDNNIIVQQGTGIIDRCNREIYEGDILVSNIVGDEMREVYFQDGMFTLDGILPLIDEISQEAGHKIVTTNLKFVEDIEPPIDSMVATN